MDYGVSGITVLCVDDEPAFADTVAAYLEQNDGDITATGVTTVTEALSRLDDRNIDCIVSDYDMPDIDGLEFLEAVRAKDPDKPFILFTGRGDESLASEAISAGVTDYMQKGLGKEQYAVLARRVRNAVEQVRATAAAASAQSRTKRILDAASDAVLISLDDTVVYANPAAAELYGATKRDELYDRPLTALIEPAAGEETGVVEDVIENEAVASQVDRTIRTLDGDTRRASVTACDVTWDGESGTVSVISGHDQSDDREQRLEALHEATRRLLGAEGRNEVAGIGVTAAAEIIGLDANAVHLVDEEGRLEPVAATAALRSLVDELPTFEPGDSIAWRMYEQGEAAAIPDVRADEDTLNPETEIRSELYLPLGEYGILIAASTTVSAFDETDIVVGRILAANMEAALAAVERDERLRDRERELSAQNERLEQFAGVVSHDLRNPLNVAIGRLEVLKESYDEDSIAAIDRALERMQALIDDLLVLARTGQAIAETEPVALATAVEDCWATTDTEEATLVVDSDRQVQADVTRLKQLLENLIRNAVEHGGPDVTVTVSDIPNGFAVSDDGPGVPEADREAIFESGYSTTEDGTGFGLPIVSQIAAAHGWTVTVTDSDDGGARFEFTGVGG